MRQAADVMWLDDSRKEHVVAILADQVAWEAYARQHGITAPLDGTTTLTLVGGYAFCAARRLGLFDGSWKDWLATVDVEPADDSESPSPPRAGVGPASPAS